MAARSLPASAGGGSGGRGACGAAGANPWCAAPAGGRGGPRPAAVREGGREVDLAGEAVDALDLDVDRVAEPVAHAGRLADERRLVLADLEALAAQSAGREEALEHVAEAHEEPAADEADDLSREHLLPAFDGKAAVEQDAERDVVALELDPREVALARGAVVGGRRQLGLAQL